MGRGSDQERASGATLFYGPRGKSSSSALPDTDRVEELAQLLRQHLDADAIKLLGTHGFDPEKREQLEPVFAAWHYWADELGYMQGLRPLYAELALGPGGRQALEAELVSLARRIHRRPEIAEEIKTRLWPMLERLRIEQLAQMRRDDPAAWRAALEDTGRRIHDLPRCGTHLLLAQKLAGDEQAREAIALGFEREAVGRNRPDGGTNGPARLNALACELGLVAPEFHASLDYKRHLERGDGEAYCGAPQSGPIGAGDDHRTAICRECMEEQQPLFSEETEAELDSRLVYSVGKRLEELAEKPALVEPPASFMVKDEAIANQVQKLDRGAFSHWLLAASGPLAEQLLELEPAELWARMRVKQIDPDCRAPSRVSLQVGLRRVLQADPSKQLQKLAELGEELHARTLKEAPARARAAAKNAAE